MTDKLADYYERRLQELALQMVDNLAALNQADRVYQQEKTPRAYDVRSVAESQYANTQYDFNEIIKKYAAYIDSHATV